MPKNAKNDPLKPPRKKSAAASNPPVLRGDWDRKLEEARAKRQEILSARALAQSAQDQTTTTNAGEVASKDAKPSPSETTVNPDAKRPAGAHTEANAVEPATEALTTPPVKTDRWSLNLSSANAIRALFVFCGGLGLGLGAVLGFGLLLGMGVTSGEVDESSFAQTDVIEETALEEPEADAPGRDLARAKPVNTSVPEPIAEDEAVEVEFEDMKLAAAKIPAFEANIPTGEATTSIEVAEPSIDEIAVPEVPVSEIRAPNLAIKSAPVDVEAPDEPGPAPVIALATVPALPDMLDKDIVFVLDQGSSVSIPEFSNVKYMREDLPIAEAAVLRRLPAVEETPDDATDGIVKNKVEPVVFIHAPDGLSNAQLNRYVSKLESNGIDLAGIGRESFRVSTTHLRYYSDETAEAAKIVARDLGVEARDFSQNARVSDRIEVWVAGRPKAVKKKEGKTSQGVFYWLGQGRKEER